MRLAKKKRGAPTKLNPQIHDKIVAFVRAGSYVETAASASGISKNTFYDWLRRGAAQDKGIYRDFSDAVEKALAESEIVDVDRIGKAAKDGQWQAAAWRLERRFPDRWGRSDRYRLEHSGSIDGPQIVITLPSNGREAK